MPSVLLQIRLTGSDCLRKCCLGQFVALEQTFFISVTEPCKSFSWKGYVEHLRVPSEHYTTLISLSLCRTFKPTSMFSPYSFVNFFPISPLVGVTVAIQMQIPQLHVGSHGREIRLIWQRCSQISMVSLVTEHRSHTVMISLCFYICKCTLQIDTAPNTKKKQKNKLDHKSLKWRVSSLPSVITDRWKYGTDKDGPYYHKTCINLHSWHLLPVL